MKKLLVVCFVAAMVCSCNNVALELSFDTLQMTVGEMKIIDASLEGVEWSSSNEQVATVTSGIVEAVGVGYATVSAVKGNAKAECQVYVSGKNGETLSLTPAILPLKKGDTYQYEYSSTYDVPCTFSSSDEDVATVTESGLVTARKGGNAIITLTNGLESVTSRVAVERKWDEYKMVWSDEFDGTALNTGVWNIEVNGGGGGNKELQYYTDRAENLRVEDGNLVIEARMEEYKERHYTSGRINSRDKKYFKYGKVEARIMFPAGGGTWPAFWMMGNDYGKVGWPKCGEIDIIEHIGNQPTMASFALHTPYKNGMNGTNWNARAYKDNLENTYHVYGIEWQQEAYNGLDRIIFTIDGEELATVLEQADHVDENYYWPFNKEHFIIFNLAIGGNMGGKVNDDIFSNPILMKVDWVRVWQRNEIE